ncbi:MAG: type VI secretion system baseplate subunit TssG [Pirellulaceae bacterium]|nr:type VI secretion system baseplate subunit TssG [Pirellulaceae bacterium]
MASPRRNSARTVGDRLSAEAYHFAFVQVVRIIEHIRAHQGYPSQPVGYAVHPEQECLRILGSLGRSFAPAEVAAVAGIEAPLAAVTPQRPVVTTTFMGLYGPSGVLPQHDNQRIINRGGKANVEKELLDLFHHRILSLFYRASTKYRLPFAYDRHVRHTKSDLELTTRVLLSVAGLGFSQLQKRLCFSDELVIKYCQYFGQGPKNASSLARMLESVFGIRVSILPWQGRWLSHTPHSRSIMPHRALPAGQHCQLGRSLVLGERVWEIQRKFRVRIGPVDRQTFQAFLPGSKNLTMAMQMVRLYIDVSLDFDIQLEIRADEVPQLKLNGADSRLGLNAWLISRPPTANKTDAVFGESNAHFTN